VCVLVLALTKEIIIIIIIIIIITAIILFKSPVINRIKSWYGILKVSTTQGTTIKIIIVIIQ
jgi:hypothetical protein